MENIYLELPKTYEGTSLAIFLGRINFLSN